MAAEPVRLSALELDGTPAPCRLCGLVVLVLSLASWMAIVGGAEVLARLLF